jgi:hypothetical protein
MNRDAAASSHFHIRWSGTSQPDWQPFTTREAAKIRAHELAQPGERFCIEEFDESCSKCRETSALSVAKTGNGTGA